MDAASGPLAYPKDLLRTSLAACTAFQQWDGHAWTSTEAAARIYFDALPPPQAAEYTREELESLRPFAIISRDERGMRWEAESVGGLGRSYRTSGRLVVTLERNFPSVSGETDPHAAADRQFENMVGALIVSNDVNSPGLLELSGTAGYLLIRAIEEAGPFRVDPRDVPQLGDYQRHFLFVEWGRAA